MNLNEDLRPADLRYLVDNVFEVDSYSSKMGNDQDISVISFNVKSKDAAEDLESFIEKGYKFVLDADVSPGEVKEGKYKVFVEVELKKTGTHHEIHAAQGNLAQVCAIEHQSFSAGQGPKSNQGHEGECDKTREPGAQLLVLKPCA